MVLLFAAAIVALAFYLLAIITEEFFVPAIDKIAQRIRLSSDASGATLLAAGSSAPEFFTSLFTVLGLTAAQADVGAGTIVGSAIFNVLVIVGAAALFKSVKLHWQPILRDLGFYIITILLLLWAFWDGQIVLHEALVFVGFYLVYVFAVVHWRKWLDYSDTIVGVHADPKKRNLVNAMTHSILSLFIPNPEKRNYSYLATFLLSITAIAALSWLLVEQIVVIAGVFAINPTFLALTVLAAGTSIPDLVGSIVVAKQGRGDMAVSNAIGSNVFDILFGLGLPWMIVLLAGQGSVSVSRENLTASVFLLLATVVAILFLLVFRRWKIGQKSGLALVGLYAAYCLYILFSV